MGCWAGVWGRGVLVRAAALASSEVAGCLLLLAARPACPQQPLISPGACSTAPLPSRPAAGEAPERLPQPVQLEAATGLSSVAVEAAQAAVRTVLQGDTSAISRECLQLAAQNAGLSCWSYCHCGRAVWLQCAWVRGPGQAVRPSHSPSHLHPHPPRPDLPPLPPPPSRSCARAQAAAGAPGRRLFTPRRPGRRRRPRPPAGACVGWRGACLRCWPLRLRGHPAWRAHHVMARAPRQPLNHPAGADPARPAPAAPIVPRCATPPPGPSCGRCAPPPWPPPHCWPAAAPRVSRGAGRWAVCSWRWADCGWRADMQRMLTAPGLVPHVAKYRIRVEPTRQPLTAASQPAPSSLPRRPYPLLAQRPGWADRPD